MLQEWHHDAQVVAYENNTSWVAGRVCNDVNRETCAASKSGAGDSQVVQRDPEE